MHSFIDGNVIQENITLGSTTSIDKGQCTLLTRLSLKRYQLIKINPRQPEPKAWSHTPTSLPFEGPPGGGVLVPFQNCPMFPCSHTLSECFRTVIFRILFPRSQKLANVPLFPLIFCQCSLVPKTLGRPSPFPIIVRYHELRGGTYLLHDIVSVTPLIPAMFDSLTNL